MRTPRHSLVRRLLTKIHFTDGCWFWVGAKHPDGYGNIHVGAATHYAHRVVYELFYGAVAPGLEIDHLCRQRGCVNPLHLEAVSHRVNCLRGEGYMSPLYRGGSGKPRATHCKRGHEFTDENTKIINTGHGRHGRRCIACYYKKVA